MRANEEDRFFKGGEDNRPCGLTKSEVGKRGEELAKEFLLAKGLEILATNWRSGHNELDIVATDNNFVRFVEVRTLIYPNVIEPFETMNWLKKKNTLRGAQKFIGMYKISKEAVFDVVSVVFNGENYKLEYFENAFEPQW